VLNGSIVAGCNGFVRWSLDISSYLYSHRQASGRLDEEDSKLEPSQRILATQVWSIS
jgi:hypothetical protein